MTHSNPRARTTAGLHVAKGIHPAARHFQGDAVQVPASLHGQRTAGGATVRNRSANETMLLAVTALCIGMAGLIVLLS